MEELQKGVIRLQLFKFGCMELSSYILVVRFSLLCRLFVEVVEVIACSGSFFVCFGSKHCNTKSVL